MTALIKDREGDTYVKAHQKPRSEEGDWNNRANMLTKQGALLTHCEEKEVISVVTRVHKQVVSPEMLDLQAIQEGDKEMEQILEQKTIKGKGYINKDLDGLDLREQPKRWLVPKQVRTELIQYVH